MLHLTYAVIGGDMSELPSLGQVGGVLASLFGAKAAGRGLTRLLGPATDEVAEALRRWTAYRLGNVARIAENANAKLGGVDEPGQVSPRVAMRIFEEGSFSDDDFVVDYLGGVLASSWSPVGRDDRGNSFASLVARLSTYDLRTHYTFYTIMRNLLMGRDINFYVGTEAVTGRVYIPTSVYDAAMDFGPHEDKDALLGHSISWLERESLLVNTVAGGLELMKREAPQAKEEGIIIWATGPGIALYLWAHGQGQYPISRFLDPEQSWGFQAGITIPPGSQIVSEMTSGTGGPSPGQREGGPGGGDLLPRDTG
jgi:hypothetical protein